MSPDVADYLDFGARLLLGTIIYLVALGVGLSTVSAIINLWRRR